MHRDALAARDVAHDLFSADRAATACAIDEQVVVPADFYRCRLCAAPKDSPYYAADTAALRLGGCRRRSGLLFHRDQFSQRLPRGKSPKADTRHQVVGAGHAVVAGDALKILLRNVFQVDAIFFRLALHQLAADLDGTLTLVDVEPMFDLLSCPRRLHKTQP